MEWKKPPRRMEGKGGGTPKQGSARNGISYHLWAPAIFSVLDIPSHLILVASAWVGVPVLQTEKLRLSDPRDLPRVTQLISGQAEAGIRVCRHSLWFCCYATGFMKAFPQIIFSVYYTSGLLMLWCSLDTGTSRSSLADSKVWQGLGTIILGWGSAK